jgi:D-alanine-D-alanine ligase-like ATP-grasp enzyme
VVTPDWTESKEEASKWLGEGVSVVCRTKLNGHSGEGIVIASKQEEIVDAPLYTKYILKKHEYRIHVFNGKVIFQQRKARKKDVADDKVNWKVRNLAGGFIYANQDVNAPDACKQLAIDAVAALELHFGAVDIIWNEKQDKYYVLEINTAPGLTGSTLDAYVEAFNEL